MNTISLVFLLALPLLLILSAGCGGEGPPRVGDGVAKSDEQWRQELTPEEYQVLREGGTERAFHNEYWNEHRAGEYHCAACDAVLFDSDDKFDSGTGWPSYTKPASADALATEADDSLWMSRTEIRCRRCGGHLGHVFPDGPAPTGLRYCVNSASLDFRPNTDGEVADEHK